jgi:hypothetical protein
MFVCVCSAVDAHVGAHLMTHCIGGLMRKRRRTVVLVTHQLHALQHADRVVLLDGGKVFAQGTLTEVAACDHKFVRLMQTEMRGVEPPPRGGEATRGGEIVTVDIGAADTDTPTKTGQASGERRVADKLTNAEDRATGGVGMDTYKSYITAAGGMRLALLICFVSTLCQTNRIVCDGWLAAWAEAGDLEIEPEDRLLPALDLSPRDYVVVCHNASWPVGRDVIQFCAELSAAVIPSFLKDYT